MELRILYLLISILSFTELWSQTVTLTGNNEHVRVNKKGTVTFSGQGVTLEEIAKEEKLTHISGRTYRAAVIYNIAFSRGLVDSRGKIFNCTDKAITVTCSFYDGNKLISTFKIPVKARTFNRMLPDGISVSSVSGCNRIVCSDLNSN